MGETDMFCAIKTIISVHKKGKSTLFSFPWNIYRVNPTCFAFNPGYPAVNMALILKKIQMTPGFF